jgi:hypothetical protein
VVAVAAGVHVECAVKVLGVLDGWDLARGCSDGEPPGQPENQ